MTSIFDKTAKGREEIASRKYGLSSRLRPLLVMVDGKKPAADLLSKVAGLGLAAESLVELVEGGYIEAVSVIEAAAIAASPPVTDTIRVTAETAPEADTSVENRFLAVYQFYNDTIKNMIGLRGYPLQLRVERASTLSELRQLRQPYLEAVQKAKGTETARSLCARLDLLLGPEEKQPASLIGMNG